MNVNTFYDTSTQIAELLSACKDSGINPEELVYCKTDGGRYAIRPGSWVGIYVRKKDELLLSEKQCDSLMTIDEEEDAKVITIASRKCGARI